MKVRFSTDMIRFRLDQEEVDRLSAGKGVFLSLDIAPTSVTFVLEPVDHDSPTADSRGGVRIGIPSGWLSDWPASDVVGFDFEVDSGPVDPTKTRIVVEKDFPCSHDGSAPPKPIRMS